MSTDNANNTSEARFAAVKALYSKEITPNKKTEALMRDTLLYYQEYQDDVGAKTLDKKFFKTLIEGVFSNLVVIDERITRHLDKGWKFERIGTVIVAILRLSTFELLHYKKTPFRVVIDEYVHITASYFDDDEVSFVNAILDKIASEVRDDKRDHVT